MIDPSVLKQQDELACTFHTARPFRHVAIDNFLDTELCAKLLADFPAFEERHALNERGEVGAKAVRMDVRMLSDSFAALDRYLQTPEFLQSISAITGIPDLLYDPDYIGGGTHENRQGQGLDPHVDFNFHPRTRWHRRLNLIVYLNPEWKEVWGGTLELHSDPWSPLENEVIRILPLLNRAVVFETTEASWHGFSKIQLPIAQQDVSRKSFAIYLYTATRNEEETAAPHATIYVPETLPEHWQAGHTLSVDDARVASDRFENLRTQLQFLYEREKSFNAQILALEYALAELREAQRLPIQGYVVQAQPARGMWPDGWASAEFSAVIVPTRAMCSLQLQLWMPPQLDGEQVLHIECNAQRFEHALAAGESTIVDLPIEVAEGQELTVQIKAQRTWIPSSGGSSHDERALAYQILGVLIEHTDASDDSSL